MHTELSHVMYLYPHGASVQVQKQCALSLAVSVRLRSSSEEHLTLAEEIYSTLHNKAVSVCSATEI